MQAPRMPRLEFIGRFCRQSGVLRNASAISFVGAISAVALEQYTEFEEIHSVLATNFNSVVGFLLIFRTSQAYLRYVHGCELLKEMEGSIFEAASVVMAYVKVSTAAPREVEEFQRMIVTLFSTLNACIVRHLEASRESSDSPINWEGVDILGADDFTHQTIEMLNSTPRHVSLVCHWIQGYIVEGQRSGVLDVPPPLLSQIYNWLAFGMIKYENCLKLIKYPIPIPYSQAALALLIFHLILTPVAFCRFTDNWIILFVFTFVSLFTYWALFLVAEQLEDPFGNDELDLNMRQWNDRMNSRLILLASAAATHRPAFKAFSGPKRPPLASVPAYMVLSRQTTSLIPRDHDEDDDESTSLVSSLSTARVLF